MRRRSGWWLGLAAVMVMAAGCVSRGSYDALRRITDHQAATLKELKAYNRTLAAKLKRLQDELPVKEAELRRVTDELAIYREQNAKLTRELENRFAGLREVGVSVEKWGLRVAGAVLFDPGRHTLKASGKAALRRIAPTLKGLRIRVEGHTDSDPVRVSKHRYPYGNLELSGRRALEVAHFLVTECGLDPRNVSYCGMGEWYPVAPNDTPAGKARNRRVDIRALEVVRPRGKPKP